MDIPCTFNDINLSFNDVFYRCLIKKQYIPDDNDFNIIGQHLNGKTNDDVTHVQFSICTITKVPKGLTKLFPNMQALRILESKLENISKEDLSEYKNIKRFICKNNEVEFLPGDLFEDFYNLEWISFFKNKLKVIEPNILDGHDNVKVLNLRQNLNYDKYYSVYDVDPSNASLEEVKDDISYKFYKSDPEFIKNFVKKLSVKNEVFTDILSYIHDESSKDIKITIKSREFKVHKFLLAARSPQLAELLQNNPEVENLHLVDIPIEIFEQILNFIYTNELPREDDTLAVCS